jgi:hypothetical protein
MKYILSLACLVLALTALSQVSTDHVTTEDINSTNWVSYVDNQDFSIEFKRTDCDLNSGLDQQYFFVRITNKTQNEINLRWEMDLFYNSTSNTCGDDEYQWQYTLAPNQSVEGDCAIGAEKKLRLFSKFIDANYTGNSELTGFQFSNLIVE